MLYCFFLTWGQKDAWGVWPRLSCLSWPWADEVPVLPSRRGSAEDPHFTPKCSAQTCSWQLGVSHSEQPFSDHISAGNPTLVHTTAQPKSLSVVALSFQGPLMTAPDDFSKGPLGNSQGGWGRLCSAASVLGAFTQWRKRPSPHTARCELAAPCSWTICCLDGGSYIGG